MRHDLQWQRGVSSALHSLGKRNKHLSSTFCAGPGLDRATQDKVLSLRRRVGLGRKQAVERAHPRSCAHMGCLTLTHPEVSCPDSLSKLNPGQATAQLSASGPQPTLTGSVQASLQLNPQRHSHLPARGPAAVCSDGAAGRLRGALLLPSAQGQPRAPQEGAGVRTQLPSLQTLVSSPVKDLRCFELPKERAEGAKSGRHSGQLPCCRHCQPLGASWRKGHLGQQRGSAKAWRRCGKAGARSWLGWS